MHYCHYYVLFCISMHYYSRFSVLFSSLCMVINTMQNYLLLWNIIEYSQYDDLHHALLELLLTNMHDSGLLFNILDMIIISMHNQQYSFVEYSGLCSIIQDNQNYCHDALLSLLCIILHQYALLFKILSIILIIMHGYQYYAKLFITLEYN